eukprot:TRINITY_DN4583_c0_g1_i3.p1 TRINITY_DN4583_c0_g1~~TRINITY_DN4583_c0_g1_i3.p1  ORF type:complete len:157 (+),score=41.19 TRINITY_DN4583_c0_g1_i3:534-1004(+)
MERQEAAAFHSVRVMLACVCVYALGIATMAFTSTCRIGYTGNNEMLYPQIVASIGAVSFVASDSILCYKKFVGSIPDSEYWVMITYWLAEFCLGFSLVRDFNAVARTEAQQQLPEVLPATPQQTVPVPLQVFQQQHQQVQFVQLLPVPQPQAPRQV